MGMTPFPDVKFVTGTKKECRLALCHEAASSHDDLCARHTRIRIAYTALELGGLTALCISGFLVAPWLGFLFAFVSLVVIGVSLEMR